MVCKRNEWQRTLTKKAVEVILLIKSVVNTNGNEKRWKIPTIKQFGAVSNYKYANQFSDYKMGVLICEKYTTWLVAG